MNNNAYKKDLHAVLGVEEGASPEALRKAYLALAVKYHPDRNPGNREAEERFKDISQAYAILSDPVAKARYERFRPKKSSQPGSASGGSGGAGARPEAGPRSAGAASGDGSAAGTGAAGASAGADNSARPGEADFDEVLANFFKTAKGRETLRDLESELSKAGIKFKVDDFAEWVKKKQPSAASPGRGESFWDRLSSWLPGASFRAGKKERQYEVQYQISLTPQVAATGTTVEITYQRDERSPQGQHHLKVKIPAGTKNGDRLRLAGQGRLKPDQSRGDLILTVLVGRQPSLDDLFRQNS